MDGNPLSAESIANSNAQVILRAFVLWFTLFVTMNGSALAWMYTKMPLTIVEPKARWLVVSLFAAMNLLVLIMCLVTWRAMRRLGIKVIPQEEFFPNWFLGYTFSAAAFLTLIFTIVWLILPCMVLPKVSEASASPPCISSPCAPSPTTSSPPAPPPSTPSLPSTS